jgi:hypothetical protein
VPAFELANHEKNFSAATRTERAIRRSTKEWSRTLVAI